MRDVCCATLPLVCSLLTIADASLEFRFWISLGNHLIAFEISRSLDHHVWRKAGKRFSSRSSCRLRFFCTSCVVWLGCGIHRCCEDPGCPCSVNKRSVTALCLAPPNVRTTPTRVRGAAQHQWHRDNCQKLESYARIGDARTERVAEDGGARARR